MDKVVQTMYRYQRDNNSTRECIANTQYLRDCIVHSGQEATAKAVFALYKCGGLTHVNVHMVVDVDGIVVDPSYEVAQYHPIYCYKIHQLPSNFRKEETSGLSREEVITMFLEFMNYAKDINDGVSLVTDLNYYNGQADFINAQLC